MKDLNIDGHGNVELEVLYYPWEFREDSEFSLRHIPVYRKQLASIHQNNLSIKFIACDCTDQLFISENIP